MCESPSVRVDGVDEGLEGETGHAQMRYRLRRWADELLCIAVRTELAEHAFGARLEDRRLHLGLDPACRDFREGRVHVEIGPLV